MTVIRGWAYASELLPRLFAPPRMLEPHSAWAAARQLELPSHPWIRPSDRYHCDHLPFRRPWLRGDSPQGWGGGLLYLREKTKGVRVGRCGAAVGWDDGTHPPGITTQRVFGHRSGGGGEWWGDEFRAKG